jgi:hypothetical protein
MSFVAQAMEDSTDLAAERIAVQLPQAHHNNCQNTNDLVRAAVGWNGVFGGHALESKDASRLIRSWSYDPL